MSPLAELPAAELSAFLGAIADDPDDGVRRLVFADWLDEHNDPRGEFIRLKVAQQGQMSYSDSWRELGARAERVLAGFREAWVGPECPEHLLRWYTITFPGGLPDVWLPGWGLDESPDYPHDAAVRRCLREGWVICLRIRGGQFADVAQAVRRDLLDTVAHLYLWETEMGWLQRLAVLAKCPRLRSLTIHAPLSLEEALPELARIPGLRKVSLAYQTSPDAGLIDSGWRTLTRMFSGAGSAPFPSIDRHGLRTLEVRSSTLSGPALQAIGALRWLTALDLTGSKFRPAWLRYLAGLEELRTLDLSATRVTDAALLHLAALPQLRTLELKNCERLSDRGVAALLRALPGLEVNRGLSLGHAAQLT